jgi:hypothetical protein
MKKFFGSRWLMIISLCMCALQSEAQWKPTTEDVVNTTMATQTVIGLTLSDTTFYAVTYGDIFRSTDKGASWNPLARTTTYSYGSNSSFIICGNYFIAATSNGIFRSGDKGMSWSSLNMGSVSTYVLVLAVSGTAIYAGTVDGVYRSMNDGTTWEPLNTGMRSKDVMALAFNGTEIYAGTDAGIFRSKDKGVSWVNIYPTNAWVTSLAVNGAFLFAGTNSGLYRSADSGATWSASNTNYSNTSYHSFAVADGGNIFAGTSDGIFYSGNNGVSWTQANNGMTSPSVYALVVNGADLYAGLYNGGMWKRPLSEMTTAPPAPLPDSPVDAGVDIPISPTFSWKAVTGADSYGFQLSTNANFSSIDVDWSGFTTPSCLVNGLAYHTKYYWRVNAANAAGSGAWSTRSFTTVPAAVQPQWVETEGPAGRVFALTALGTYLFAGTQYAGIFRSTNNGLSWQKKNIGLGVQTSVNGFLVFGTTLFAAISDVYSHPGVYISTDSGTTWGNACAGLPYQGITSLAASDSNIFVGTYGGGVYVSTNFGTNWTPINNGLTNTSVSGLAVSGMKIFAGTGSGVFLTTDHGENWKSVSAGLPNAGVVTLAVVGTNLFASISNGYGVYRSADDGAHWTEANIGLTDKDVGCFVVSGTNLFAGAGYNYRGGGVYLSTDNGASWMSVSTGLKPFADISALAVTGTTLYAADYNIGMWRRPLPEMFTSVESHSIDIPTSFRVEQNYPNPFNPTTTISFSLPTKTFVSLEIYDVMGRNVATMISETLPAGNYSRPWNAAGMPSGVYFYRVRAGQFTETRKLLLQK